MRNGGLTPLVAYPKLELIFDLRQAFSWRHVERTILQEALLC